MNSIFAQNTDLPPLQKNGHMDIACNGGKPLLLNDFSQVKLIAVGKSVE